MAKASSSIDLSALKSASSCATNYVTTITDASGIWVTPQNKKPDNNGNATSTTTGVRITDQVDIFRGTVSVAAFGESARVGQEANGASRTVIDPNGMQIIRRDSYGTDIVLANIGYGEGAAPESGTEIAPYFTFGRRLGNIGSYSVAEGEGVYASGSRSHAEGSSSIASGYASHAEGGWAGINGPGGTMVPVHTTASGTHSHAEGSGCVASASSAHAEGSLTVASGLYSHAQNLWTIASSNAQTALGKYNISDTADTYAVIVGNGTSDSARSNALTVDWNGGITISNHSSPIGSQVNGTKVDTSSTAIPDSINVTTGNGTSVAQLVLPAGVWIVYGQARFASNSTGYRRMGFSATKNNASLDITFGASSSGATQISNTRVLSPSSQTTYYLNVTHNGGTTLAISDIVFAAWRLV